MNLISKAILLCFVLSACEKTVENKNRTKELKSNDQVLKQVAHNAKENNLNSLFSIDHSRLAAKDGEIFDASKVAIYSNPIVNSQLLEENIRIGLDLPYRVQSYYHKGELKVVYTDSHFLKKRHDLGDLPALSALDADLKHLVSGVSQATPISSKNLTHNYGIVELTSSLDFESTINSLKKDILAEGDTVWFYTLDYQKEALEYGIKLPPATLLVFGGPAPGAKAMRDYPSLGLDAFGQKVLVYSEHKNSNNIKVIYNKISDLAKLHYNDSSLPHKIIEFRLKSTLSGAIEE
ncbi:MAG: DUF302 domain-containing protein [Colwellia sp.]